MKNFVVLLSKKDAHGNRWFSNTACVDPANVAPQPNFEEGTILQVYNQIPGQGPDFSKLVYECCLEDLIKGK